jgi:hypothetical protein
MYAPRELNVRMKFEDMPGRTSGSLPHPGAAISYRASGRSLQKETAPNNNDVLKSGVHQTAAEPKRLAGTLSTRTSAGSRLPTRSQAQFVPSRKCGVSGGQAK